LLALLIDVGENLGDGAEEFRGDLLARLYISVRTLARGDFYNRHRMIFGYFSNSERHGGRLALLKFTTSGIDLN
jgi:hypothetical protein